MVSIDRRSFLVGAGLGLAGALTAGRAAVAQPQTDTEGDEWSAVRAQFDLAPGVVHLSCVFLASHPRPVRDAIERYRQMLDADPLQTVERAAFGPPEENFGLRVKRAAATYLGGAPEEIALTQSTTMSLALIYAGLPLRSAVAPELELPDFRGGSFRLSSLLGTKVLLVAWASW